ncbi:MAG: hypothetical protein HOO91_01095 [Bacteroidales bacterium]|nr:hypothetical protein [Bacteroidales bacterium]
MTTLFDRLVELENLKTGKDSGVAQKRGLDFERLVRDLFLKQNILSVIKQTGYHTSDNRSEQIDGVINFNGKIFLLEVKWDEKLAASSLYEFIGKIENKFYGTLGIFISYHELSDNFINALRKGRKQNVIVLHGDDIKMILEKEVNLKNFFKYALEKLSFDNLSHISVKEFCEFEKLQDNKNLEIQYDSQKVKDFIQNNITSKSTHDSIDLEIELDKLSESEKAKVYTILLKQAKNLLQFRFPKPTTYINTSNFFSIYKPDFAKPDLSELPNKFFGELIFEDAKTYLLRFLDEFLDEFPKIDKDAKKKYFDNIVELYNRSDWEIENALTEILKLYSEIYPPKILKQVYKLYIEYYYSSSREDRFAQKSYAISLIKNKKIDEATIIEWINEKVYQDLKLYQDFKEFNFKYFAQTYANIGQSIGYDINSWIEKMKEIYKNQKKKLEE